ncbi:MAG: adenylate/guanylate cyclase domain-containing protein [Bacteroidetes bacterium]|nr:adenylate/guanylate cyclase domain-containing protein [Bacteroidota bacterium]
MSKESQYTARAQRFAARFPLLTYLSIQVNFWVIANILLGVIMHLHALAMSSSMAFHYHNNIWSLVIIAIILGILYGVGLGLVDYFLDKRMFRQKPLGKIILLKTIIALVLITLLAMFTRFILYDRIIAPQFSETADKNFILDPESWNYFYALMLVYYFFMTLVITFINQVNKKYGPGILVPLLLGKYRNPREEERIFMFMDLQSSTTMVENLGHLKYSSFIRDSFSDINEVLSPFFAEIYQYVGDEIVLTWRVSDGLKDFSCIKFFFACEKQFRDKADYYNREYGCLPFFKAGVHMGKVTVVEIGEIKRDIAYHGDTLNTAARIQSVCNDHNKKFLVSEYLLEKIGLSQNFETHLLGMVQLKGKTAKVGIASIDGMER